MKLKLTIFILFQWTFGISQTPRLVIPIGHTSGITSVCFSGNGKRILTGSRDFSAKVWDLSAHEIQTFKLDNEVQAVAFSPGADSILTGSTDGKVKLWTMNGELLKTLTGHKKYITSVAFSPDGKTMLTGSDDATAKLWDAKGKLISTYNHTKSVTSVAFSNDGKSILTGSEDKTAVLWNLAGAKLQTFAGHKGGVMNVRLSNDGKYVLTGSSDRTAMLWNRKTGVKIKVINHKDKILACDFAPDNQKFASASFDGNVKIYSVDGKELNSFKAHEWGLSAISFAPGSQSIVTTCEDATIMQWDLKGNKIQNFQGHAKVISALSFSPDGNSILSACRDNTARYWDIINNKYHHLKGHQSVITSVACSPDGNTILTGSEDKTAKLWDRNGKVLQIFKLAGKVTSVSYSIDGKLILAGCFDGCTKVWETSGKEVIMLKQVEKITTAAFSPDGKMIATASVEGIIRIFDLTGKNSKSFFVMSQINSMVYSSDGKTIITGAFNGLTKVWDAITGEAIQTLGTPGEEIYSVAASKDGKWIATGRNDGLVILWNPITQSSKELHGHSTKVTSVYFSPDSKILASGSVDGTIRLWDITTAKEILNMVSLDSIDWAVKNPTGLFDASTGSIERASFYYLVGLEVVGLDQLKERYYEPGLLGTTLGITKSDSKDVSTLSSVALYPELDARIVDQELNVNLKVRNGGMGKLSLFINNKEVAEDANPERKQSVKIDLNAYQKYFSGDSNKVSLMVYNSGGWLKSQSYDLPLYNYSGSKGGNGSGDQSAPVIFKGKPSLFAVIVGTSDYSGDKLDLKFPDLDAKAIANGIELAGKRLFENRVFIKLLSTAGKTPDAISSKKNIENIFKDISTKATPGDVLLVYFSGHGMTYGEAEKGQFYYLTKDISSEDLSDPDIRKNYTVSSDDLTKWLTAIPAQKQVMIFDACHSGKVVESLESIGARDLSPSQIRALDRMKDRTGMFILTGSAADKVSFEASQFGQGLLTYSLLQGMSGLALTEDKRVDVATLFNYARDKVPELAKGINKIQIPVVAFPKGGGSFDIGIVDASVKITLAQPKPVFIRNTFQNEETFADEIGITDALSDYFRTITAKGAEAEMIYVDVNEYQNAYSLKGLYNVKGAAITLRGKLYKDKISLGEFQASGDKNALPDLIDAIFEKVNPLIN